jgi:hypothetical protein
MTLKQWEKNGWLKPEPTSRKEISNLQAMPLVLGTVKKGDAAYLDSCRVKRNTVEYDYVGGASDSDANELIAFAEELRAEVLGWLEREHPEFL